MPQSIADKCLALRRTFDRQCMPTIYRPGIGRGARHDLFVFPPEETQATPFMIEIDPIKYRVSRAGHEIGETRDKEKVHDIIRRSLQADDSVTA